MSEDSEKFMKEIQDRKAKEEKQHKKHKKKFIISCFCILLFAFITCLGIYLIAIDWNKEPIIPISMASFVCIAMSIYYAVLFGRKYYYREREVETARRDRARARALLESQNEKFEEESDSRSSPGLTNPATDGPSDVPQTESSTLSEQTSTQESSEKTSLSNSSKGTFTTTAIIERVPVDRTSTDALSTTEEKIASRNEDSKPSTSSQPDSADCLTLDADNEGEIGKVRHRTPTPE